MYARALPAINADGSVAASPTRTGRYGEAYTTAITNKELFAADEGAQFVAVNPTAGTGILGHAAPTTFDETKPNLYIVNPASNTKRIYLQSILLTDTVVSVGGARSQYNFSIDTLGAVTNSGGTALTINNVNMGSATQSAALITAGAVVLVGAPTASRRLLGNYVIKGANIDVVWDTTEFIFGAVGGSTGSAVTPTTTATYFTRHMPPVCIDPGQVFKMVIWAASMSTGPTFEYLVNYIER